MGETPPPGLPRSNRWSRPLLDVGEIRHTFAAHVWICFAFAAGATTLGQIRARTATDFQPDTTRLADLVGYWFPPAAIRIDSSMSQSADRFTNRVETYSKYRPGYPAQIVDLLRSDCDLTSSSVIADVGSGTGKLSEIFLNNGNQVLAVEPNRLMRTAAESIFSGQPGFVSIAGTAEATSLPEKSVDFVVAGQAFHWFDYKSFRTECLRILKPGGWVVLVWNARRLDSSSFLEEYESLLLRYGTDYQAVRHENSEEAIKKFFAPVMPKEASFPTSQSFDLDGFRGRVFSSSYTPEPGQPNFQPMITEIGEIFRRHEQSGKVLFEYDTQVFYGQLR